MSKRRKYSEEFKRDALQLLESSGKSISQIERDLDITQGLLSKWKRRYRLTGVQENEEPGLAKSEQEEVKAENRHLKRELMIAQQERDILKKAISIFSKSQG